MPAPLDGFSPLTGIKCVATWIGAVLEGMKTEKQLFQSPYGD